MKTAGQGSGGQIKTFTRRLGKPNTIPTAAADKPARMNPSKKGMPSIRNMKL